MLGTRGCRLGLQWPEVYEMQVRAIVRAAVAVRERTGQAPLVEIMHPLVGFAEELKRLRALTLETAAERGGDRLPRRDDDRAAARVHPRRRDRRVRGLLLVRDERPDADDARHLARRRGGQVPDALPAGRDPRAQPVRDARPVRGRRPDADRGRAGDRGEGHQARHLRRARRRAGLGRVLPRARARLRVLLAVPRAGCPARGCAGGAQRGGRQRPPSRAASARAARSAAGTRRGCAASRRCRTSSPAGSRTRRSSPRADAGAPMRPSAR